jgi:hypothetical protein
MTSIEEEDDVHNKIIAEILKICTDGCTEQNILEQTHLSHDQLRNEASYSSLKYSFKVACCKTFSDGLELSYGTRMLLYGNTKFSLLLTS